MVKTKAPTQHEVALQLASALRRTSVRPSIAGYKPHESQKIFHSSKKKGRLYIGGNRCLGKGTLVLLTNGSEVPIEQIEIGDEVFSLNEKTGLCEPSRVLEVHSNGLKECFEYEVGRYKDKFKVVSTRDHKFYGSYVSHGARYLTTSNWFRFTTKDSKLHRSPGTITNGINEERALFLGLILGDGHIANTPGNLQFSCADPELIKDTNYFIHKSGIQYGIEDYSLFDWLKELGLVGTRSATKFIPKEVWLWNEESISNLIAGLIATDGSIYCNKDNEWHLSYSSNSKQMVNEFRRLMGLRLGIWGSTVTYESRGTYSITYGTAKAFDLIYKLNIPGKKKHQFLFPEFSRMFSDPSMVRLISKKELGEVETFDITIDSKSNLYVLANGLITHNSGKTVGGAAEAIMWLRGEHPFQDLKYRTPIRGRAIGVDFDNGIDKIIKPEIARWVPPSLLKNGSWEDSYSRGDRVLTLTNGSTLEFMSYDQDVDKFAGTSRHFIWFDEEPPEDIFNENMARLIDTGGHWWMTMTPLIDMSWTYDRLYVKGKGGVDPNIDVFEVNTSDNPHINLVEMEILTEGLSDEEKKARLHGTYISQSGTIYSKVLKKENFIPSILESEHWPVFESKWGHFGMLDHGYRNPTAFYLGCFNEDGKIIIYEEYYEAGRLVKENALAILSLIRSHKLTDKLDYIVADPSIRNTDPLSGSSVHQEYSEHGLYLSLANNDVTAGILRVSGRIKSKNLLITNNCKMLIWESGRYRWDKFASSKIGARRNLKESPVKKDDHAMDAMRYGVMSRPALPGEVDTRVGNVLNAPVSVDTEHFIDKEVLQYLGQSYQDQQNRSGFDPNLGSEW